MNSDSQDPIKSEEATSDQAKVASEESPGNDTTTFSLKITKKPVPDIPRGVLAE